MDLMQPRINTFFHACHLLVYSIFIHPRFPGFVSQEENDQAFSVSI